MTETVIITFELARLVNWFLTVAQLRSEAATVGVSQENNRTRVFNKFAGLKPATLLKKGLWQLFSSEFRETFKNTSGRLVLLVSKNREFGSHCTKKLESSEIKGNNDFNMGELILAQCCIPCRNQSFDLQCKSNDGFLYGTQRWTKID